MCYQAPPVVLLHQPSPSQDFPEAPTLAVMQMFPSRGSPPAQRPASLSTALMHSVFERHPRLHGNSAAPYWSRVPPPHPLEYGIRLDILLQTRASLESPRAQISHFPRKAIPSGPWILVSQVFSALGFDCVDGDRGRKPARREASRPLEPRLQGRR